MLFFKKPSQLLSILQPIFSNFSFFFFFRVKEFSCRRRYSDFVWLREEVETSVAIVIPPMPPKAYFKQLPFLNSDDGIFDEEFIEDRRVGLEEFINKLAGRILELDYHFLRPTISILF